jgi:monofunctional glycosyltransferase
MKLFTFGLATLFLSLTAWIWWQVPSGEQLKGCVKTKMYSVHLCPGTQQYVSLANISAHLQRAVVVSEDSTFWTHNGFDFSELSNSLQKNIAEGEYIRGGSTLSQQLAKNMFLDFKKSIFRKILEAFITLKIESTLSKKEILERYLNVVEFGAGIYGVKSAAQFYFGKAPSQLDLLESAFLTMLLPSPKKYSSSYRNKSLSPFAKTRMKKIITLLAVTEKISETEKLVSLEQIDSFFKTGPTDDILVEPEASPEPEILEN